jgi:hypothetical protein
MKAAVALVAMTLAACANAPLAPVDSSLGHDLVVQYRVATMGMGGTPIPGVVMLTRERPPSFMAMVAVEQSLNAYRCAIATPDLLSLTEAVTDVSWTSDTGYIPVDLLNLYNAKNPPRPLQGQIYGVKFTGRVRLVDSEMRYRIGATVMQRGGGQDWRAVPDQEFDGGFFVTDLIGRVRRALEDRR